MRRTENFLRGMVFLLGYAVKALCPPFYSFTRLEKHCKTHVEGSPDAYVPRRALATLYRDYLKSTEARRELEVLLQAGYKEDEIFKDLGEVCYRLQDFAATIEYLEPLATRYSNDNLFAFYLGMSYMRTNAYEKAIPYLLRAQKLPARARLGERPLKDVRAHVYNAIGYCFFSLGQFDSAAEFYSKGISVDPSDSESLGLRDNVARSHIHLADRLLEQGKRQEAIAQLHMAIEIRPGDSIVAAVSRTLAELGEDIFSSKLRLN